ncbi:MAG: BatA domain-containing protein [Endomicrobiales bacterium]
MTFLNPSILWALPLALGPLFLHLFYRKKPKRREFSDLRFLRRALENLENRLKLRQYLLLLVRTLLLLLLVIFFSRPVWQAGARAAAGGNDEAPAVVLLVDVSYSMGFREEGGTRLDRFKNIARRIISVMPARSRMGIIAYSDRVEAATPVLSNDTAFLNRMIDALALTSRPTDARPAWRTAQKLLERTGEPARTIVFLSDAADHGFPGSLEEEAGTARVVIFTPEGGDNFSIFDAPARFDEPERAWHIAVSGEMKCGRIPESWPVNLFIGDRKVSSDFARAGRADTFTQRFVWADDAEEITGRLELASDRLSRDNVYYIAGRRPAAAKVWIIDGDPKFGGATAESFYLKTAFPQAEVYTESEMDRVPFTVPGMAVLANVREFGRRLEEFIKAGGGAIIFTGSRMREETWPGYFPASAGSLFEQPQGVSWNAEGHPVTGAGSLAGFEWQKIEVEKGLVLQPRGEAVVLARLASGWPFLVEGGLGAGKILLFCSTADREWNNLPGKPVFAPLLQGMLRHTVRAPGEEENRSLRVGEAYRHARVAGAEIVGPSGRRSKPPASGDEMSFADTEEPGIYRLFSGNREIASFAVNVDGRRGEGDLAPAAASRLREYFGDNPVAALSQSAWENEFIAVLTGKDISRQTAAAVFLLLIAEILLAHTRAPRREKNGESGAAA